MNYGFEIKTATELLEEEKLIGSKSTYKDEKTKAYIFELLNGQFILLPAVGNKGLLIPERKTLEEILATRIPLEDNRPSPLLKNQQLIIGLPGTARLAIEKINEVLNTSIELQTLEFDIADLNKKVRKFGCEKAYEELSIELGILLCETMRKKEAGLEYKFETRYGYNPYFTAILVDQNGNKLSPWYYLNRFLIEKKRFNFEEIQERTLHFRL